ncbi:hypothetical protein FIBSPDRAFT_1039720 [Athelia psychrophila]|uniref:NadR/Ttd14 AAA domain-containing protein n=1 Tax=Athelia psychrophila TaxID=1759441 RepID=A0A166RJA7_9AGAM|nr:hypothetical protein FIBSPDRAFT_1039720 [Fibularhizoctonia sp. CBS 109695]
MPSSTKIREIFIIGPSSTGKTTLCTALAEELVLMPECWITETARHVMRTHGFTRDDVGKLEMQSAIMHAQIENEKKGRTYVKGMEPSRRLLLSDRSAIDAVVYTVLTSSSEGEAEVRKKLLVESAEFQHALKHYRGANFILLRPVPEWLVDDGVRSLDDQEQCLKAFRKVLSELGIKFEEMGSEMKWLSDRVAFVVANANLPKARL